MTRLVWVLAVAGCGGGDRTAATDAAGGDAVLDGAQADTGSPGRGALGDPCTTVSDCESRLCVAGPSGSVCSRPCESARDCPQPFECTPVEGLEFAGRVCLCGTSGCERDGGLDGGVDASMDGGGDGSGIGVIGRDASTDGGDGGGVVGGEASPVVLCGPLATGCAGVTYVNRAALGANDGASWASAFTNLQAALDVEGVCEIWIAEGTYVPTRRVDSSNPRSATFVLPPLVRLFGGFVGTETSRDDRTAGHETVISGDVGGDDGAGTLDDNLNTLLSGSESASTSLLIDRVTLSGAASSPDTPWTVLGATAIRLAARGSNFACRDSRIERNHGRAFAATLRITGCMTMVRCEVS